MASAPYLFIILVLAFSNGVAANPPRRPGTPWRGVPSPTPPAPRPGTPSQQAGDCYMPLLPLSSCFPYLTNASETTAQFQCCDGLRQVIRENLICLCHVLSGEISRMSPSPLIPTRMYLLPLTCAVIVPPTLLPMSLASSPYSIYLLLVLVFTSVFLVCSHS